jgi:hypothetical protein
MRLDSNKAASPFAVRHSLYWGNLAVRCLIKASEHRPLTPRLGAAFGPRKTRTLIVHLELCPLVRISTEPKQAEVFSTRGCSECITLFKDIGSYGEMLLFLNCSCVLHDCKPIRQQIGFRTLKLHLTNFFFCDSNIFSVLDLTIILQWLGLQNLICCNM